VPIDPKPTATKHLEHIFYFCDGGFLDRSNFAKLTLRNLTAAPVNNQSKASIIHAPPHQLYIT
jgi:hypothetical protein